MSRCSHRCRCKWLINITEVVHFNMAVVSWVVCRSKTKQFIRSSTVRLWWRFVTKIVFDWWLCSSCCCCCYCSCCNFLVVDVAAAELLLLLLLLFSILLLFLFFLKLAMVILLLLDIFFETFAETYGSTMVHPICYSCWRDTIMCL